MDNKTQRILSAVSLGLIHSLIEKKEVSVSDVVNAYKGGFLQISDNGTYELSEKGKEALKKGITG